MARRTTKKTATTQSEIDRRLEQIKLLMAELESKGHESPQLAKRPATAKASKAVAAKVPAPKAPAPAPQKAAIAPKKVAAVKKIREPLTLPPRGVKVTSWWAAAWNRNLARYADFSNRIDRGKSYCNTGRIVHFAVAENGIEALVQGSRSKPYEIVVAFECLPEAQRQFIAEACRTNLSSLEALAGGAFPQVLEHLLVDPVNGIFPKPKEITFSCNCPDWAVMCKHVAAVLYGVGIKLESDPLFLFPLRGMSTDTLMGGVLSALTDDYLMRAATPPKRVLPAAAIADIFGIALEDGSTANDWDGGISDDWG